MRSIATCIASAVACFAVAHHADVQSTVNDGGSVVVHSERSSAGYTTFPGWNEGSTLRRSLVTLDDSNCPLAIVDAGVLVSRRSPSADHWFGAVGRVRPRVPISAFEVRFVLLDIFGGHLSTLSKTEVKDLGVDDEVILSELRPSWTRAGADWEASSHDVRELLTVVSFVAHVRTGEGVVWRYDEHAISERLRDLGLYSGELRLKEESAP